MAACELISNDNLSGFLDSFDTVLTDCDGVLWNGQKIIPGAPEAIEYLRSKGKRVFYVTNNSTKSRDTYVKKCAKLGYKADENDIIGSAHVLAQYIKHKLKLQGKVYLVGGKGVQDELQAAGIQYIKSQDENLPHVDETFIANMELDPEVKCVVVGYDFAFNYLKLATAGSYLRRPGVHFCVTNTDAVLPMGDRCCPGTGSLVAAVEVAGGRKPDAIMGKPHPPMFDMAHQLHHINPERTIMIGDRLDTDIEFGYNTNLRATLLVLTGVATLDDVKARKDNGKLTQVPHYYLPSLGHLWQLIDKK